MNFWTTEIENIRNRKYWKNLKIGPRSGMVCIDLSRNKTLLMGIKNHSTIFLDFCFLSLSRGHVPKFIFVKESCKKLSLIRLSQFHQIAAKIPGYLSAALLSWRHHLGTVLVRYRLVVKVLHEVVGLCDHL